MRQRKRELPAANGSARLCLAPTCEEAWLEIILPWFEQVSYESWRNSLPSLVVVPTRGQANDLKARLIAKNISYLGVQFLTPAGLERLFASDSPTPSVRPEHLRLLLAIAASEISGGPNDPEMLAAKAVARAPASLLGTLNWLNLAGWNFEYLALPSFAPVVQRFSHLVKKCGFVLPGDTHRIRLQEATKAESKFSSVLVANFDGAHWPYWFLLRTAVELATNATVVIEEPRENFFDADLCWIGSWEEIYGEARHPAKSIATFGDSLFSEAEMRGQTSRTKDFDFLIGTNVSEQAEAIARQCVRYLAADNCTRLGVIFSAGG